MCCELLSDFVYSFFEHNGKTYEKCMVMVVNCFQILYIRSLNTMPLPYHSIDLSCELLSDFVYSFFEHNPHHLTATSAMGCELLSDFVYSFFEHNEMPCKTVNLML